MAVLSDIWRLLNECEVVLVDFTEKRPNVFLEYGMALVLGKPIVAITQSKDDVPSDTPQLKWTLYSEKSSFSDLKDKIPLAIEHAIADIKHLADEEFSDVLP